MRRLSLQPIALQQRREGRVRSRIVKGNIAYTAKNEDGSFRDRGREDFLYVTHNDGSRALSAYCEIDEPAPNVLRHVVLTVDADDKPVDAFVRVVVGGQFSGAGFFRISADSIECESYGPSIGRIAQSFDTGGNIDAFNTHPLSVDGYHLIGVDPAQASGLQRIRTFLPSLDHRGAGPPMIADHHIMLAFVGRETVSVAAGTFDTKHFRFVGEADDPNAHPPYDVWVSDDEDCLFVKGQISGSVEKFYELRSLER